VALARGFLGDSLAEAWQDSLGGRIHASGIVHGSLDTLGIQADLEGIGLHAGSYAARHLTGFVALEGAPSATRGLITFQADTVLVAGYELSTASMDALIRDARWADATVRVASGDTLEAEVRTDVHWTPDSLRIRLDSLTARAPAARWALAAPAEFYRDARSTRLDTVSLASTDGASLDVAFDLDSAGPVSAFVRATRMPLRHARFTGFIPPGIDGLVSLEADMTGTQSAPLMQLTGRLDSVRVDGVAAPELTVRGDYADRNFDIDVRGRAEEREVFTLTGALPLDLSLRTRTIDQRLIKEPLFVRIVADGSSLSGFEALLPGVSELSGGFDADMLIGGTWGDYEPRGVLLIRDGAFAVPALGTGFRDLLMDVSFSPDSVVIHRARLADARSSNDTATVEGAFSRTDAGWRADFTSMARYLRVVDDPRVAEADVSWQLQVRGPFDALVVTGEVFVPNANAYIGAQQRRVLDVSRRPPGPDPSSVFVPRLEGLTVRLGNEVRLRSQEVNVQLTGELQASGPLNDPSFAGTVVANRGTYRLDLGLLQRTFQVDSGVVRLAGSATAPHRLDIFASYIVRQAQQEDVLIGARLTGTTHEPRIVLSSTALGTAASETEIISYLLFGAPSFALDGNRTSALRQASAALVPSLGGAVERALGGRIPFISELRVTTVASDAPISVAPSSFESLLNSFALTAGSQLGTDTFLSVSTGVCRGQSAAAQALGVWFGIAAEYRPRERLSAQISLDPGSSPCLRVGSFSQIYQFGLDIFRDWRW
jgi:translocation and assembly module TamB